MNGTRRSFLNGGSKSVLAAGLAGATAACAKPPEPEVKKPAKQAIGTEGQGLGLPFSPAIRFGNLLFVSGQMALDSETRKVIEGGIEAETRYILENMKELLEAAGSGMDRVLKCTVFLTRAEDFQGMNEVYRTFFPTDPPARSTVGVKELMVPGGHIELECFAYVD
jgi:2-iminobutanoate/2-iminopropanoate deaminase